MMYPRSPETLLPKATLNVTINLYSDTVADSHHDSTMLEKRNLQKAFFWMGLIAAVPSVALYC
jgi:hypothetical protein